MAQRRREKFPFEKQLEAVRAEQRPASTLVKPFVEVPVTAGKAPTRAEFDALVKSHNKLLTSLSDRGIIEKEESE